MKGTTNIQLLGTPSTTYTYIKHVIEKVMERADITLPIEEITDIKKIIHYNVDVIPTLKIDGKVFPFHARRNTNDLLKEAILFILKKENYGHWPVVILASEQVGDAFYLAQDLAYKSEAVIEWILEDRSKASLPLEKEINRKGIEELIKGSRSDWMGQIFADPLINYSLTKYPLKSACLSISEKRNTVAVVTDRHPIEHWSQLINWMEHCTVPLIVARGKEGYSSSEKITVIGDIDPQYTAYVLSHLVNGKKNNISFHSVLPALTTNVLEGAEVLPDVMEYEEFFDDIPLSEQPDMWAFQFTSRLRFKKFLKDKHTQHWLSKTKQPLIFLPFQ